MVSIIMGVYNGENTLEDAIKSILKQTYKDWELIICDDCSTDDSYKIMLRYEKEDPRIRLIQNECNCGLATSLNHCLTKVRGEYIARMDCDDLSEPERLERQVACLEQHPEIELVGTYMQAFDEIGKRHIVQNELYPTKYDLPKGAPFSHATILIRTYAMQQLKGYRITNYTVRTEDVDLWYRFFAAGFHGMNLSEPLYWVRIDSAAYKRRKLRYMLHASYIIWYGCDMVDLPFYYKIYCLKPILSWLLPKNLKINLRRLWIK